MVQRLYRRYNKRPDGNGRLSIGCDGHNYFTNHFRFGMGHVLVSIQKGNFFQDLIVFAGIREILTTVKLYQSLLRSFYILFPSLENFQPNSLFSPSPTLTFKTYLHNPLTCVILPLLFKAFFSCLFLFPLHQYLARTGLQVKVLPPALWL